LLGKKMNCLEMPFGYFTCDYHCYIIYLVRKIVKPVVSD